LGCVVCVLASLVKRLAEHESKKVRAKQMQAFEDEENRKKREKAEKKEQELADAINKIVMEIKTKETGVVKKADFFVRYQGRRASHELNRPKQIHFADLVSKKKDHSVKKLPRYHRG
jgi:predicted phage gp36 major capsid-like protein